MTLATERVIIFVDGENLRCGLIDNGVHQLRHDRFYKKLARGRTIVDCRHYDALHPGDTNKQRFLEYLRHVAKARVIIGTLRRQQTPGGLRSIQKGVDVMLASDLLVLAMIDYYDTAIIVSNDSDFVPAINYVKQVTGKKVEVVLLKRMDIRGQLRRTYHELMKVATPIEVDSEFLRDC